jgi:hypothetical protein
VRPPVPSQALEVATLWNVTARDELAEKVGDTKLIIANLMLLSGQRFLISFCQVVMGVPPTTG